MSRELTEEQKQYIKSSKLWRQGQELLIESLGIGISNSEQMVKNHTRSVEVLTETLNHEIEFLANTLEMYNKWCADNEIIA